MASQDVVSIDTETTSVFKVSSLSRQSAEKASRVLQENHDKHHIFFNDLGFHNHIVHHIATVYALGASPLAIQARYDENASYQRPRPAVVSDVCEELRQAETFLQNMGKPELYSSYLKLFQAEMEESKNQDKDWRDVVHRYVFADDKRAQTIFNRLFAGFYHPLIHLGFGLEFEQPAIVAEALSQACAHSSWLDQYFVKTSDYVQAYKPPRKSLLHIIDNIRADKRLSTAVKWSDDNKLRDGVLLRAKEEMISHAAQWQVDADSLEEAAAEMIDTAAYFTGAAQRRGKLINFDFYFIHCFNSSIFFPMLVQDPRIPIDKRIKLLEWKGRLDLAMYASRRSPELLLDEIESYKPSHSQGDWSSVFTRASAFKDDGHASKFVRALAHGERYCKEYESKDAFPIKGPMWLQLANMVMDSVEITGADWIRSAGFDEAWEGRKNRSSL